MEYRAAVAEGKRLLKRSEEEQWALARLTHSVVTEEKLATATKWAIDLGISPSYAQKLRAVWARYGQHHDAAPGGRTFGEYLTMAGVSPERAERLEEVAEQTGLSVTTIHRSMGYGDKVEAARALLGDPKVAEDVLRDARTRAAVSRASQSVHQEIRDVASARERERTPTQVSKAIQYEVIGELTSARYRINKALERLKGIELDDEIRESILEVSREVQNSLDWITAFLESGDRSFEEQLQRLLAEGR